VGILVLGIIIFILAAALLGVGQNLKNDGGNVPALGALEPTTCTLGNVTIAVCSPKGYVAVWQRIEDGTTVIEGPSSFVSTVDLAERAANNYPLRVALPCMCSSPQPLLAYPKVACGGTNGLGPVQNNPCMLNVDLVVTVQQMGGVYAYASPAALATGALLLVVSVLLVVFLCISNGFCACCGGPKPTDAFVKMTSE
jgi:hypothetical protein